MSPRVLRQTWLPDKGRAQKTTLKGIPTRDRLKNSNTFVCFRHKTLVQALFFFTTLLNLRNELETALSTKNTGAIASNLCVNKAVLSIAD